MKKLHLARQKLTPRQQVFAEIYVAGYPDITKTEAALKAGFSEKIASKIGSQLTNADLYPRVVSYMETLRDQKSSSYRDYLRHLKRLDTLAQKAEAKGQYAAAVNAEFRLGQAAGFYIDKKEIKVQDLTTMSKDELIEKIKDLQNEMPKENTIDIIAEDSQDK